MSVLFVSHDLGVIRYVCDRVAVIYGGQIVETGRIEDVIGRPRHRYTTALLAANPGMPKDDDFSSFIGQRLQTHPRVRPGGRALPERLSLPQPVRRTRRTRAPRPQRR